MVVYEVGDEAEQGEGYEGGHSESDGKEEEDKMPIRQRGFQSTVSPNHASFSCKESCPAKARCAWY